MTSISRRSLIQGAAVMAASTAVVSTALADAPAAYDPAEVIEADIVVVGSGTSGMCATVQAAELGAKTICLEKNAFLGGNGLGTEGVFALGTSDQEAAGIEVPSFREIIATDAVFFNYRINSLFWKDMVENSAALEATVARYNEFCHNGLDEDFDKEAEYMAPIETPPFYIFRQDMSFWTSIGGIDTDRQMRVVNVKGEPVPGLYAVGTDGCQLYRETYMMNIPASCQGNNVNSGRIAAQHICENLL